MVRRAARQYRGVPEEHHDMKPQRVPVSGPHAGHFDLAIKGDRGHHDAVPRSYFSMIKFVAPCRRTRSITCTTLPCITCGAAVIITDLSRRVTIISSSRFTNSKSDP